MRFSDFWGGCSDDTLSHAGVISLVRRDEFLTETLLDISDKSKTHFVQSAMVHPTPCPSFPSLSQRVLTSAKAQEEVDCSKAMCLKTFSIDYSACRFARMNCRAVCLSVSVSCGSTSTQRTRAQ